MPLASGPYPSTAELYPEACQTGTQHAVGHTRTCGVCLSVVVVASMHCRYMYVHVQAKHTVGRVSIV